MPRSQIGRPSHKPGERTDGKRGPSNPFKRDPLPKDLRGGRNSSKGGGRKGFGR